MCLVLFFPETPRWLISKDRAEEALAILAKYHGEGDPNHPIVQLQYREIREQASLYTSERPWWDYRELGNTRAARYRLAMVIMMAFFGQWSGNNVVSYFMPQMIKEAGIDNTDTQLLLNAINPIFSMIAAIVGASMLDKLGRRVMMMYSLAGSLFFYVLLTAFSAESANNRNLAYGVIVSIYLFGICFAWGFTPLQTLYSVECLENRTRAKGSGLNFLFLNIAMVINTYGISEGIAKIKWRLCKHTLIPNAYVYLLTHHRHCLLLLDSHRNRRHLLLRCRNCWKDARGADRDLRSQEPSKGEHQEARPQGRHRRQCCRRGYPGGGLRVFNSEQASCPLRMSLSSHPWLGLH